MRTGYRLGSTEVVDAMYQDGFLCPLSNMLMGETADKLAREMETIAPLIGGRRKGYKYLIRQFVLAPLMKEPLQRAWSALTKPALVMKSASRNHSSSFNTGETMYARYTTTRNTLVPLIGTSSSCPEHRRTLPAIGPAKRERTRVASSRRSEAQGTW